MPGKNNKNQTVGNAFYISVNRLIVEKVYETFAEVFNRSTCNLKLLRQDKESLSAKVPVITNVMENIEKADVIFCNLSYSSSYYDEDLKELRTAPSPIANANVYFELGYAFALKKKVYLFLEEDRKEHETPPFNIRPFSIIEYTEGNLNAVLTKKLVPDLKREFEWFEFNPPPSSTVQSSPTDGRGVYSDFFNKPGKK